MEIVNKLQLVLFLGVPGFLNWVLKRGFIKWSLPLQNSLKWPYETTPLIYKPLLWTPFFLEFYMLRTTTPTTNTYRMSFPISSRTRSNWLYLERLEDEVMDGDDCIPIGVGVDTGEGIFIDCCCCCLTLLVANETGREICVKLTELFASSIACSARKEFMSRFWFIFEI